MFARQNVYFLVNLAFAAVSFMMDHDFSDYLSRTDIKLVGIKLANIRSRGGHLDRTKKISPSRQD